MAEQVMDLGGSLPVGTSGRRSLGWWGLVGLIATEGALFGYLIFTDLYLGAQNGPNWRPDSPPLLRYGIPMTVILAVNSCAMLWAVRSIRRNFQLQLVISLIIGFLLAAAFIVLELLDWFNEAFTPQTSAFGSSFFVTNGFHLAHIVAGAIILALVALWSMLGYFDSRRNVPVLVAAAYWHFTNFVWLLLFILFYIAPRLY